MQVDVLQHKISHISKPCKITIFAGTGGNGGDGFVAARHLLNMGFEVDINFLGHPLDIKSSESLKNWEILNNINIKTNSLGIHIIRDSSQLKSTDSNIVVDAILGTGTRGNLREPVSRAVDIINNSEWYCYCSRHSNGIGSSNRHGKSQIC